MEIKCLNFLVLNILNTAVASSVPSAGSQEEREGRSPLPAPLAGSGRGRPLAVGPPTNVTGGGREEVLLVTPILRCGSTTLTNLLHLLAPANHFTVVTRPPRKSQVVHIPHPPTHVSVCRGRMGRMVGWGQDGRVGLGWSGGLGWQGGFRMVRMAG